MSSVQLFIHFMIGSIIYTFHEMINNKDMIDRGKQLYEIHLLVLKLPRANGKGDVELVSFIMKVIFELEDISIEGLMSLFNSFHIIYGKFICDSQDNYHE